MKVFKNYYNNILFRNLSIVFCESIVTKALSFFSILILSKSLGPEDYGKYSFIFVAVAFLSAFFDFGMENTAVRYSVRDKEYRNEIFGLYLLIKIIITTFIIMVLWVFGDQIFFLIGKSEIEQFIPFLIIGFLGESLFFVNDTFLQAIQKFKLRAMINILRYLILVVGIIILKLNELLLLKYVFYIYFLPLLVSLFFTFKYYMFLKSFFSFKLSKKITRDIYQYGKWMFLISISNNTLGRIDFFLISFWVSYQQIGIYNIAFQLSAIISFIPFAFGKVLLPKMSELSQLEILESTNKITKSVLILTIGMSCLVPIVHFLVPILLGEKYIDSVEILQVMIISSLISVVLVPIEQAVYSLGKPVFITIGKYVQIVAIVFVIIFTVPFFGLIWAAISVLIARIIYGSILIKFYLQYKKNIILKMKGK
ncbi:lipopolysaccharide biosynthesis protein [Peribacillus sp. RS7]|uniref:lipopolysaccharide biosynthesis protein n=1 Tax=Peribacillus sp. RS7 TaxID=3242679 RepID=UPI0035BFF536